MPSIKDAKNKMEDAVTAVSREFATVRTGKATPALLDTIRVDAYGSKMPINQLATVSSPDASLLVVQPFDQSLLADIERAIQVAGLGFNPANDGTIIRIPVPPLNEERRKEYVKLLHKLAEDGRVSVRHVRQEARDDLKRKMKDHEIADDEGHRKIDEAQKLTDQYIGQIDDLLEHKEKDVMQVG
jgi:ribosome recycling factor